MTNQYQSVFRPDLFADQVILVTGGGSGIGRCIAHELASLGARVLILGRTQDKLDRVVEEITEDGGQAGAYAGDIRDEAGIQAIISQILARHGAIHGLVNNAGGQFPAPLSKISAKGFETVVRNNLVGGFIVAREVFNQCMNGQGGSIVNITADCVNGFPGLAHTGAARAGMENLTRSAAWEWGPAGVRVNAVAPGLIASSGLDSYDDFMKARLRTMSRGVPLNRLALEAEVSSVVCFLLSPAASFINGDTIRVDGGAQFGSSATYMPLPEREGSSVAAFDGFHRAEIPKLFQQ